jgi:septum formation protein
MSLNEQLKKHRVILASQSPRRKELLKETGLDFVIMKRDYDESYPEGLSGEEVARFVSAGKARSFKEEISDNDIVVTADTIVWCNNKILGKPVSASDAFQMLKEISGNTHEVITAVTLFSRTKEVTFSASTKVTFEELTEAEIKYYIENFKPYDKAGAYGIQEWIGIVGCSHIEGSYFNVVGLPVQKLYEELKNFIK